MAYQFQKINDLFGDPDQKQNIFGQPQGQGQPQVSQPGDQASQGQPLSPQQQGVQLTQAAGATQGSGAAQTGAARATSQTGSSKSNLLQKSIGQTQAPAQVSQVSQGIQQANQSLQDEANQYTTQGQQQYATQAPDVGAALNAGTNSTQFGQIKNLLGQQGAGPVTAFKSNVTLDPNQIANLASTSGLRQSLQSAGGPQYTAQQAAFDAMSLQNDPNYRAQMSNLASQEAAAESLQAQNNANLTSNLQTYADSQVSSAQQAVRDQLTQAQGGIASTLAAQALAENQARAALRQTPDQTYIGQQVTSANQDLSKNPAIAANVAAQLAGAEKGVDPTKYFTVGNDVTDNQFYTPDQASQFNAIMSLLNPSGGYQAAQAAGALPGREGFDTAGYEKAVQTAAQNAATQQQAKLTADQTGMNKIIDQAKIAADNYNKAVLGYKANTAAQQKMISDALSSILPPDQNMPVGLQKQEFQDILSKANAGNYFNYASSANPSQFYNSDQITQLNNLLKDSGLVQTPYATTAPQTLTGNAVMPGVAFDQSKLLYDYGSQVAALKAGAGIPSMTSTVGWVDDQGNVHDNNGEVESGAPSRSISAQEQSAGVSPKQIQQAGSPVQGPTFPQIIQALNPNPLPTLKRWGL